MEIIEATMSVHKGVNGSSKSQDATAVVFSSHSSQIICHFLWWIPPDARARLSHVLSHSHAGSIRRFRSCMAVPSRLLPQCSNQSGDAYSTEEGSLPVWTCMSCPQHQAAFLLVGPNLRLVLGVTDRGRSVAPVNSCAP